MRIYLTGFMGSGKSTLGSKAALAMEVPFMDTDTIVESQSGLTIPEIFDRFGESHFRHLEADVLRQTAYYEKSIIATGGGMPCFDHNMAWMSQYGITIYLEWPDELLLKNLKQQSKPRPLLPHPEEPTSDARTLQLLHQRKSCYTQSAITIEMSGDEEKDLNMLVSTCRYIW